MRAIIFFALMGIALAAPKNAQRIIGGSATAIEDYPFMANMHYFYWESFWMQSCGGALITSSSILSAANCYQDTKASDWRARLGTAAITGDSATIHEVSHMIIHPGFSKSGYLNDVAIVKLATPAQYSRTIQPARIAGPTYILPDNTDVVTLGWGLTHVLGGYSPQLQSVVVQTINQQVCANRYAQLASSALANMYDIPTIGDDKLCSGVLDVGGKGACNGDNGGPLIHGEDIIIGVTSWGWDCAHATYPGFNARVSYFSDWIAANGAS